MHKIDIPQILDVTVEKLSNLGYGIAKVDGYVIFIENACPKDKLKIKITKKNKNFAHAEIIEILEPSPYRVEPFCKMQKICGACQIQFIDYEKQLDLKKEIVKDTMHSIYGDEICVKDVIPSPKIREYRHKIQYPISETKDSKRILAGYYKSNSHNIVNIKYCPIQPEYCDKIIDFIREKAPMCGVNGYLEKEHIGLLRHVVIRASALNKKNLVTLVINADKTPDSIKKLAKMIYSELDDISGVGVNFNKKRTNIVLDEKTENLFGNNYIEEKLCDKIFNIGAKTFFQVNPYTADNIFSHIKEYIKNNYESPSILDAYAGISAFGICLSDIASKVITVEEVKESVNLANTIIENNKIENIQTNCEDAEQFFEKLVNSNEKFDITILDPPRKGCTRESLDYAIKLTKKAIIYVSCNPATLARDLKYLKEHGLTPLSVQPFDMFPHTYHIENVVVIKI